MRTVYFLEDAYETSENGPSQALLFNASLYLENEELEEGLYFSNVEVNEKQLLRSLQSGFVYSEGGSLSNANSDPVAKHFHYQNARVRQTLIRNSTSELDLPMNSTEMFSYHVNVGHGNCSIVVDVKNRRLTLVDCSDYDYLKPSYFRQNINDCLSFIKSKFGLSSIEFSSVILTHPHYDHYSGLNYLIRLGLITKQSIFFLNQYYAMPSPKLNTLIRNIGRLGSRIVEPISSNSSSSMDILYPDKRVVKSIRSTHYFSNAIVDNNPNNASMVFLLRSGGKGFLFTGDIETQGWDRIASCKPYLRNCDYYAISHHGSINGHDRTVCPAAQNIKSLADCASSSSLQLLMGRRGAYRNMPHPSVTSSHSNLVESEVDRSGILAKFIEIEWSSGLTNWY